MKKIRFTEEHKRKISIANKGKIVPISVRRKISKSLKGKVQPWNNGRRHWNWHKVSEISIKQIHNRIIKKFGQPKYCEICKSSKKKLYEWANKNHMYKLKISDWMRLCRKCHRKYDIENNKL